MIQDPGEQEDFEASLLITKLETLLIKELAIMDVLENQLIFVDEITEDFMSRSPSTSDKMHICLFDHSAKSVLYAILEIVNVYLEDVEVLVQEVCALTQLDGLDGYSSALQEKRTLCQDLQLELKGKLDLNITGNVIATFFQVLTLVK